MHDARNVPAGERWLSLGAGALAGSAAAYLIYRGITGYCPLYAALGIDSGHCGLHSPDASVPSSVPYGKGVHVEQTVSVDLTAMELYEFWRRLDTLPRFMQHVDEVTVLTPTRSRWRVRAPIGNRITWEAEVINDIPGQLIAWRSLRGSAIHHAGSVHFDSRDGMTEVRVVLEYAPPARYVGASLARILGEDPKKQIAEDLRRFKRIVEQGEQVSL